MKTRTTEPDRGRGDPAVTRPASTSGRGTPGRGRPGRQDGLVEGGVAFHQHRQSDLVQDGHDAGPGLADPQPSAGTVEPEVMSQEHADRLARQVGNILEVDDDLSRHPLLLVEGLEMARSNSMVASLSSSPTLGVTTRMSWITSSLIWISVPAPASTPPS